MASERVELPIGDVCNVKQGRYLAPGEMSEIQTDGTAIPVIGANGILGYTDKSSYSAPVTLVTCRGSNCGLIQRTKGPAWISNNAMACPPKPPHDSLYLHYVLSSIDYTDVTTGSAQPQITTGHLNTKRITITRDLNEQKAIARILGTLDDKIELNRRMNATLEAMARALFQSWFVDFDPVHAKAAGRQPSGMAPATAALFPASFNSDDLPLGWRLGTVNELCEINSWTLGKKDTLDSLQYVEISEVNRGEITNISTYKRGEEPSRARRRLRHGDTAMSTVRPDRGSYFLALNPPEHRVASTGFAVVTPTKAPWSFIHIALTQPEVFERLGQLADGGAYPAVRPEVIGDLKLPVPDRPEIFTAFHESCGPLLRQAEANRIQSRTLATLRDTLLPKLLSGDLTPKGI